ncbi:MAG: aminotransferase class I/II-fold pyridoxal phosphate-dependent enzyme [Hyphomicrobiaceae bacterium]
MRYSALVERIAGEATDAWELHFVASVDKRKGKDVIVLTIGDPDFATPARFTEAGIAALRAGDTHYSDMEGRPKLRIAIAERFNRGTGVAVDADNVIVTAGAQNALYAAARCIAETGDEIIALDPTYVTYDAVIRGTGARIVQSPQPAATGFRVDLAALEHRVTPRTRAIFYASPNNPTGATMGQDELEGIARVAKDNDLWVIADEVYADLTFERPHISIASLPGMTERTVTISSLSKSHAMTGWRSGWAIGPKALIHHMTNLAISMHYGLPGFIQEAAFVALTEGDAEVVRMREIYRRRRDLMLRALTGVPGLVCHKPEAGMFMMIDVSGTGLSAKDFAWRLYETTGVATLDAGPFGPSAKGFLRVAFTISEAELATAAERIRHFAEGLAAMHKASASA